MTDKETNGHTDEWTVEGVDSIDENDGDQEGGDELLDRVELSDEQIERAKAAGGRLASLTSTVLRGWATLVYAFVAGILAKIPKTGAIADALIVFGYKFKKKVTGADVLVNTIYGDGVVLPAAGYWQSNESEYKTENGERFSAKGIGFDPKLIGGKVPVVWALREGREVTEPLEAYMGTQRRLGNYEPHMRADGGTDVAIDGETAGYDGRALSFRDGWDLFGSKVSQEDMDLAEKRGKIAELEGRYLSNDIKLILVGLGGVCLGLFGPALAASIAGAGDGGSSAIGGATGIVSGLGGVLLPALSALI